MGTERIGTDDPISGTNPRDGGDLAADFLENETIHATAGKCCNQAIALMKVRFRLAPSALLPHSVMISGLTAFHAN